VYYVGLPLRFVSFGRSLRVVYSDAPDLRPGFALRRVPAPNYRIGASPGRGPLSRGEGRPSPPLALGAFEAFVRIRRAGEGEYRGIRGRRAAAGRPRFSPDPFRGIYFAYFGGSLQPSWLFLNIV
jgi:hypothetical protein